MKVYYVATSKFGPTTHRTWQGYDMNWREYIAWSKLTHLQEVISLDSVLGTRVVEKEDPLDGYFRFWEDSTPGSYTSLAYLLTKLEGQDPATYNVLAVIKEPTEPCEALYLEDFEFIGYDLLEKNGGISALTNCGGFDNTFLPDDLNSFGLIDQYPKAIKIKQDLFENNPEEPHAHCEAWAIWRLK
jgi:hypothetical protein